MIQDDTWYRCTVCGREGRVGRCCGDETRIPLNRLAIEEQRRIKKHKLRICYTCSDFCRHEHKTYAGAKICGRIQHWIALSKYWLSNIRTT